MIKYAVVRWYTDLKKVPRAVDVKHGFEKILDAEVEREQYLKDWPNYSPQNVQVIQYEI